MKKKYFNLYIKILISGALFVYLAFKVNWLSMISGFSEIKPSLYIFSMLVALSSVFFIALKYFLLIKESSISHSLTSLVKINLISQFYVIFMPSALGTEAVRWYKVTRNEKGRVFFLAVTLFERTTFIFTILIFGFLPLLIFNNYPGILTLKKNIAPIALFLLTITGAAIAFFVYPKFSKTAVSYLCWLLPKQWQNKIKNLHQNNLSVNRLFRTLLLKILGLSIIWQMIFIFRLFLIFKAADVGLNIMEVAWICSLVLLLQVLPISFAGLGIREGAYAYFLSLFNLGPEKGILIGILFFSQMIIIAIIGWYFELSYSK